MDKSDNKNYESDKEPPKELEIAIMEVKNNNSLHHLIYNSNIKNELISPAPYSEPKKSLAEIIKELSPPFKIPIKRFDEKEKE